MDVSHAVGAGNRPWPSARAEMPHPDAYRRVWRDTPAGQEEHFLLCQMTQVGVPRSGTQGQPGLAETPSQKEKDRN